MTTFARCRLERQFQSAWFGNFAVSSFYPCPGFSGFGNHRAGTLGGPRRDPRRHQTRPPRLPGKAGAVCLRIKPVWPNNSSVTFFMRLFWICFELFASLISRYALEKAAGLGHRTSR